MTTTLSLIACRSCNREISIQAATCPSCGAPNKWIHPKIEHFLSVKDSTGVAQPFTFTYEKLKLSGQTEKKIPRWIIWIAIILFLLLFVPIALLGTIGLAFGPIGIVTAAILGLIIRFTLHVMFAKNKTFIIDFETNSWQSSDDTFWLPVKKLLATQMEENYRVIITGIRSEVDVVQAMRLLTKSPQMLPEKARAMLSQMIKSEHAIVKDISNEAQARSAATQLKERYGLLTSVVSNQELSLRSNLELTDTVDLQPIVKDTRNSESSVITQQTWDAGMPRWRQRINILGAIAAGCILIYGAFSTFHKKFSSSGSAAAVNAVYGSQDKAAPAFTPYAGENGSIKLSNSEIIDNIWQGYVKYPANASSGFSWREVKGQLIKKGTIPPSAVNSSAKWRLPAYLACYDFVIVMGNLGDDRSNLCIYYVDNPSRGSHSLSWRGKQYVVQLESSMSSDGFIEN